MRVLRLKVLGTALGLAWAWAASAWAEVRDFGYFTIDVPPHWTAEQDEKGVYLTANDGFSVLSILNGTLEPGKTLAEVVQSLARQFKGSEPRDLGGGQAFSFTYSDRTTGYRAVSMITAVGDKFIYITQVGENDEVDLIVSSMKAK